MKLASLHGATASSRILHLSGICRTRSHEIIDRTHPRKATLRIASHAPRRASSGVLAVDTDRRIAVNLVNLTLEHLVTLTIIRPLRCEAKREHQNVGQEYRHVQVSLNKPSVSNGQRVIPILCVGSSAPAVQSPPVLGAFTMPGQRQYRSMPHHLDRQTDDRRSC
jgi:hypothetical protein